jgi:hypothetical protein
MRNQAALVRAATALGPREGRVKEAGEGRETRYGANAWLLPQETLSSGYAPVTR